MKIAKVTFGLMANGKKSGKRYIFNTDLELEVGEHVVVDSKGKETHAIFVGYYNGKYKAEKNIIRKATENEIEQYWIDVENKLIKSPLELEEFAYQSYCQRFKDNLHTTLEEARRKLTRNVLMSSNLKSFKFANNKMTFNYGTMEIVLQGNTVVDVYVNHLFNDFLVDSDRKNRIEEGLSKFKPKQRKTKDYTIIEPNKDELTSKGFTNKIKIADGMTKEKLLEYGFTNYNKPVLYYCRIVGHGISFNLMVDIETLEIKNIDVLDEDFCQPYDYQSMLMRDINFRPAQQVFDRVDKELKKLQNDGIIIGYKRGMYL